MKLKLIVQTQKENARLKAFPVDGVFEAFDEPLRIVEGFYKQKAETDASRHLTFEGKAAANRKAAKAGIDGITDWHRRNLAGLDGNINAHRSILVDTRPVPDRTRVDFMLGVLRGYTPEEVNIFYNSATDDERIVMEHAATIVGRIPMKLREGQGWVSLLSPERINESILERAKAKDPVTAERLQELTEIRQMHVSIAGNAASEIRQVMSDAGSRLG